MPLSNNQSQAWYCQSEFMYNIPSNSQFLLKALSGNYKLFNYIDIPIHVAARVIFVCVEVLRPSQPNGVMSSMVSLPNHTYNGQA